MVKRENLVQGSAACTIVVDADPADAGAGLVLSATVICDPACDLTGDSLVIRDAAGTEAGVLTFTEFDEETNTSSGTVTLDAPVMAGDYAWTAELPAFTAEDVQFEATTMPVAFAVRAHRTRVNVWGAPSAITAGSRFAIHVGVKCTCGCALAAQPFTVHDQDGKELATGVLGPDIWPETEALYHAEVDLPAADAAGQNTWEVRFPAANLEYPHEEALAQFGVIFTPAADHVVKVEAIDAETEAPLAGAMVTMHPYRATTDEQGIAELRVPKGSYTLFVSARRHVSDRAEVEVDRDFSTRTVLAVESRPERL